MSSGNKHPFPFLITLGTLLCLTGLSLVSNTFSFGSFTFRQLDILANLRPAPADTVEIQEVAAEPAPIVAVDSVKSAGPKDFKSYTGILDYGPNVKGQGAGMQYFMQALKALKSGHRKKVRIAYFGDSMIEGDLITQDLRDSLQTYFGGTGVGYVPATSVVAGFRTTIGHTFSPNWTDYNFRNEPPAGTELGISGHAFIPAPQGWVRYQPVKRRRLDRFEEVSLLYGTGDGDIKVNDQQLRLAGQHELNLSPVITDTTTRSLTLQFSKPLPFYGVCFESPAGVFLDNFSFRGISGIELGKLRTSMWKEVQSLRPYDLIVLHYGANVLFSPENTRLDWYERPMEKVVDTLRRLFPQTSFLIIGTADKAYKKKGRYVTAPGVKALLKIQHDFAEEHGMAYWNLFSAMGGDGAMARWVEGDVAMANKDYTHFNFRGASKVASLLYKAIMHEYEQASL